MFFNKPGSKLVAASKARLNTHTNPHHKIEAIETRNKKSPDGNPPTPTSPSQPSEVLVFNNTTHHGSSRAAHYNRSLPEVPNYEEIEKFMKDSWDERIRRINDPSLNLKVLWIKSFAEEERERLAAEAVATKQRVSSQSSISSCSSTSQSPTPPKKKGSPNHAAMSNGNVRK